MDIYDYLKMDHQKVAYLFKLFENSEIEERQQEIVAMIGQELLIHAKSEQETFYKKLEEYPLTKELALHGRKEHKDIEKHIASVNSIKKPNANWKNKVLELKKTVDHHVKEEEGPIFRKARKVLSEEEAYILKEKMHNYKLNLLITAE